MMDCTDRHDRYFLRLIAPNVLLYSEMITAQAIKYGDKDHLLAFDTAEHPLALQLGGSDPAMLTQAAIIGEQYGYDEINLNVGCPSPRVSAGRFGACLMLEPQLVAECVTAMQAQIKIPVTVKCRIGVDHQDSYEQLHAFVTLMAASGVKTIIIHARKAWLNGLSPKQNREIPPLQYDVVYNIKKDFPQLIIVINGGVKTMADIDTHLPHVDGVMIGRAAYANPYLLADIQKKYYEDKNVLSRFNVIENLLPYVARMLNDGVRLHSITRHLHGLFMGQPGAAIWRRYLSEHAYKPDANIETLKQALMQVQGVCK